MKPLFRWVGGKRRLAPSIAAVVGAPCAYAEPFVGGGAVFASLKTSGILGGARKILLADASPEVMSVYEAVQDPARYKKLAAGCWAFSDRYNSLDTDEAKENAFRESRDFWNKGFREPQRFLFLSATCFNALWRVNGDGEFNTPWGKKQDIALPSKDDVEQWHQALQGVELRTGSYRNVDVTSVGRGAVVYCDPPYLGTYSGYTSAAFTPVDHIDLLCTIHEWRRAGLRVVYSNSAEAESLARNFIPHAEWLDLRLPQTVAASADDRGEAKEILVSGGALAG